MPAFGVVSGSAAAFDVVGVDDGVEAVAVGVAAEAEAVEAAGVAPPLSQELNHGMTAKVVM
jgi:hypothetical protein